MENQEALDAAQRFMEQAGVPFTEWQRKVIAAALVGDREEVEYATYYDPPVQGCTNLLDINDDGSMVSLSMFDTALRDIYAPGLRAQINESRTLFDMITRDVPKQPRRWRRVWAALTRRSKPQPVDDHVGRTCVWSIKTVTHPDVPKDTAFMINPDHVFYDEVPYMDDDWDLD